MISPHYQQVLRATHIANPVWGNGHANHHLAKVLAADPRSVLDYGCGKGGLVRALRALGLDADGYDPGVPEWEQIPPRWDYDLVTAFDVMEHIEPDALDDVLDDIAHRGDRAIMTISLLPAKKLLVDGSNAHLIVKPAEWWIEKLGEQYGIIEPRVIQKFGQDGELVVVCSR